MPADARLPAPWRHPAFQKMRTRIETLEEENRQLRERLVPPLVFPRAWGLNRQASQLLAALYAASGYQTSIQLRAAMERLDRYFEVDAVHFGVVLFKLRRRTRSYGIEIVNRYGQGFVLTPQSRVVIREALEAIAAGRMV